MESQPPREAAAETAARRVRLTGMQRGLGRPHLTLFAKSGFDRVNARSVLTAHGSDIPIAVACGGAESGLRGCGRETRIIRWHFFRYYG